jgi:hypothetical protein
MNPEALSLVDPSGVDARSNERGGHEGSEQPAACRRRIHDDGGADVRLLIEFGIRLLLGR